MKKARDWSQMARLLTVAMATAGAPGSEVSITSLQLTANLLPTVCVSPVCVEYVFTRKNAAVENLT